VITQWFRLEYFMAQTSFVYNVYKCDI
jgi:hypothetical protein